MKLPPPAFRTTCVERFLEYVRYDTQSREDSETFPSTPGQLVLLERLRDELLELGLEDVEMDAHGYVFGTIPASPGLEGAPTIGFLAHVDTSPEMSGKDVKPIVHRAYSGGDLVLPDDPAAVLRFADNPALAEQIGNDIITAAGTTLLGADNKAGVAEIMAAAEYLMAHPEVPHGAVRVGFTPDEEIGQGTKHFDVPRFGAVCAYTMDGETLGQLECESFSADSILVTFQGFNTHPGFAKGKMINSIKVAAAFIESLPPTGLSPETTENYEGYVHPYVVDASVERTSVKLLLRDFETAKLAEQADLVRGLAERAAARWPGCVVTTKVDESYRNMGEVLAAHPEFVDRARRAILAAGLEVRTVPIRGGTDGSRLSFMGLPTPNLFAGEHNFHSRLEWVSTYDMHKAVETIVHLARIWAEDARR